MKLDTGYVVLVAGYSVRVAELFHALA